MSDGIPGDEVPTEKPPRGNGSDLEAVVSLHVTSRELRLLEFATWRFMSIAYQNNRHALQKRPDETDAEAKQRADAFWRDAKDAEALVGKLRGILQANVKLRGADRRPA